jgi:hypothetical protein
MRGGSFILLSADNHVASVGKLIYAQHDGEENKYRGMREI